MGKHTRRIGFLSGAAAAALLFASGVIGAAALQTGDQMLQTVNPRINNITTAGLQQLLRERPNTVLIDVRSSREILLLGGMIDAPRSYNIARGWLEFRVPERVPDADTPIVVYCGMNQRSPLAAQTLMQMGYANIKNYSDGFFAWRDAGLPVQAPDLALDSMLYSRPQRVADGVWSAIGATAPPSYENSGHNNNLSFIVSDDGVLVVNAGDNYLLARALHKEIKTVTDQPVRYVVLENGQGHAAMGSAYWKEQGAQIIAHEDTLAELQGHGEAILERVLRRSRDKGMGTKIPDSSGLPMSSVSLRNRRANRVSTRPPVRSARRLVNTTNRCVRARSRPRTREGRLSSRP